MPPFLQRKVASMQKKKKYLGGIFRPRGKSLKIYFTRDLTTSDPFFKLALIALIEDSSQTFSAVRDDSVFIPKLQHYTGFFPANHFKRRKFCMWHIRESYFPSCARSSSLTLAAPPGEWSTTSSPGPTRTPPARCSRPASWTGPRCCLPRGWSRSQTGTGWTTAQSWGRAPTTSS